MSEALPNNLPVRSGHYSLPDFSHAKPFSSFLPGIAGTNGIPLWVFYVNRGQAICSFGVESKDSPIMEFQPANTAYRTTHQTGFRSFLKVNPGDQPHLYEPFSAGPRPAAIARRMQIGLNELEIEETHAALGLQINVLYFLIPGERFAGLARRVTIKNLARQPVSMEILDGLPVIIPHGVSNWTLKEIGRTIEAWMAVYHHEQGTPFYRLKAGTDDTAEVETIEAGHFSLSFAVQQETLRPLKPIVDPALVFGPNTALTAPDRFLEQPLEKILAAQQVTSGKTPSALFGYSTSLPPSGNTVIYSVFGHIGNENHLARHAARLYSEPFFEGKRRQAVELAQALTDDVDTRTSSAVFDAYCRQTYLDNLLRGGRPILMKTASQPAVFHIYSRKHGDPERDYNAFKLAPEPFSQGEANYRDVNQNRRLDVFFNPGVGAFNLRAFMSLIQLDGYNPLVVRGVRFSVAPENRAALLSGVSQPETLAPLLERTFTPGQLLNHLADHEIELHEEPEAFLDRVLQRAEHTFEAQHGEGYWVDHWTYNLDLIDSYLAVFPNRKDALLFEDADLPFYDSPAIVQPREKKYVLVDGAPRQLDAVLEDPEKAALIDSRSTHPHWMRIQHGRGEIYRTTLFGKLFLLALLKFATLDPYGMGVEMEAGKPGWYDALNGLPGLFGASMAETYALHRLLAFLREALKGKNSTPIVLPVEIWQLTEAILEHLRQWEESADPRRDFVYWDAVSQAREGYRMDTRLGLSGREHPAQAESLVSALDLLLEKVRFGLERAEGYSQGVPLTYFSYRLVGHETIRTPDGEVARDAAGRPYLRPIRFEPDPLPLFLEGPVRALRIQTDPSAAAQIHRQVKASPLFDRALKMYKVNASLERLPQDIGRARAFTAGWLENESIWLHMEYKYLLELLQAGLYEAFFEDFKYALIPFQDPQRYGRSPLENSSFLVSSAHPDPSLHGTGFVARLSGATAEFLSIWSLMMAGQHPFTVQDGDLHLALKPVLPGWLFPEDGPLSFRFLGKTEVRYHNPGRLDTFDPGLEVARIELRLQDGSQAAFDQSTIPPPYAEKVRAGEVARIDQHFDAR